MMNFLKSALGVPAVARKEAPTASPGKEDAKKVNNKDKAILGSNNLFAQDAASGSARGKLGQQVKLPSVSFDEGPGTFLEELPSFEALKWAPSVELSPFPHQTWKTNRWKDVLRNPYVRVFALNYVHRGEPRWGQGKMVEGFISMTEVLPEPAALRWVPSIELSPFPHQTWKTNRWKDALRNPYIRVFSLNYYQSDEPRWQTSL